MVNLIERELNAEGIDKIWWIEGDDGAFTGPLADWLKHSGDFMAHVKERGLVLQAGGCCGMYPLFYSKYFKDVYTVEPHPDNYECLSKNCEGYDNIHHGMYALGSHEGHIAMFNAKPGGDSLNVGMHRVNPTQHGNTHMIQIDQLELPKVDLIHLDLEGFEKEAIYGALQTITRDWPVIITERAGGAELLIRLGYTAVQTLTMDTIYVKVPL